MKARILFFTYWYPNKKNESFGMFVKRHAEAIHTLNEIVVLSVNISKGNLLFKKNIEVLTDDKGIETHHIYLESTFYKLLYTFLPLHYLIVKRYLLSQITPKYKISFLHANILFPCGVVCYWLAKTLHYRFVITEHWSKIDKFFRVSFYKKSGKATLTSAMAITAVSSPLADTIKKYTSNPRIFVVPNVVNANVFHFDEHITKNNIFTFIAASHWASPKNPFYFLEALNQIAIENTIPKFKLVLAGEGVLLAKIKEKQYNFDIEYAGNLKASDLNIALNKSHVFLHGSDFETFSVIIAEAIMCGLPCVVSPVGIATESINALNGFIATNSSNDWKDKIIKCAQHTYDNRHISEQIRHKYDVAVVAKLFSEIYKSA